MKKISILQFLLLSTLLLSAQFSSVTNLDPIAVGSIDTQHKPQAKTWFHAGKWWCALPPSSGGSWVFRLDGNTWTPIYRLATSGSRADCWVSGDLVHILMYKSSGANAIASLQYNAATDTYVPWTSRPAVTNVTLPSGVEAATLTVDGNGRMWVAADAVTDIQVWWSDAPYTSWSSPITIASGVNSDDICSIVKMPGKIGVFWSNQTTGLFGFRTHDDGANPATWSAIETPAGQSAIPGNPRMADDHINLTTAADGTVYCAAKTSYNSSSLPQLILLVRRPQGTWDNLYPVTVGVGTQAIVLLNEQAGKLKIVYTTGTNGGQIVYKESSISNISFPATHTPLMGGANADYNFATSTHQTFSPDVAIVATNQGSPRQLVSVLASDGAGDVTPPSVSGILRSSPAAQNTTATSVVFAVNFSEPVTGVDAGDFNLTTGGSAAGTITNVAGSGAAYTVTVGSITGTGSLRLDLKASGTGIIDGASNAIQGGFTSGESYNVSPGDVTPPSVTSILRSSPTTQNTSATSVIFAVNFSEPVNGADASDFVLTTTGNVSGTITSLLGACANYTVTVSAISGSGTLRLDLKTSGTGIVDAAGNAITGGFNTGETYVIGVMQTAATLEGSSSSAVVEEDPKASAGYNEKGIRATIYPNPFSNDATFTFTLSETDKYTVMLYDSKGLQVMRVDEGTAMANVPKTTSIRGWNLAAGPYFIRIQTKKYLKVLKLWRS